MSNKKNHKKMHNNQSYFMRNLPIFAGIGLGVVAIVAIVCVVVGLKSGKGETDIDSQSAPAVVSEDGSYNSPDIEPDAVAVEGSDDGSGEYNEKDFELSGRDTDTAGNYLSAGNSSPSSGSSKKDGSSQTAGSNSQSNSSDGDSEGIELSIIGADGTVVDLSEYLDDSNSSANQSSSTDTNSSSTTGNADSGSSSSAGAGVAGSSDNGNSSAGSENSASSITPTPLPYYDASEGKVYETERIPIN